MLPNQLVPESFSGYPTEAKCLAASQIALLQFATTFVQWAARETLRRAHPLTLFARFTPRQRENPLNELLSEAQRRPELDPQGPVVDADMGAYYTWLNQQRLSGASLATFLAWFEEPPHPSHNNNDACSAH